MIFTVKWSKSGTINTVPCFGEPISSCPNNTGSFWISFPEWYSETKILREAYESVVTYWYMNAPSTPESNSTVFISMLSWSTGAMTFWGPLDRYRMIPTADRTRTDTAITRQSMDRNRFCFCVLSFATPMMFSSDFCTRSSFAISSPAKNSLMLMPRIWQSSA